VAACRGEAQRRLERSGDTAFAPESAILPKRRRAAALQNEFTTADVYAFDRELEKLHPDNRQREMDLSSLLFWKSHFKCAGDAAF
jgi:hypothetical protein